MTRHATDDADQRGARTAAAISVPDQLSYMADLAAELSEVAARCKCPTLARLLDLARSEALLQRARRLDAGD